MEEALAPFQENIRLYLEFTNFPTATLPEGGSVEDHLATLPKAGNPLVISHLRKSRLSWSELSKRDRKARTDSLLFQTISRSNAILGSRLYALQTLYKGNLQSEDTFQLRAQLDPDTEDAIFAIFKACKEDDF